MNNYLYSVQLTDDWIEEELDYQSENNGAFDNNLCIDRLNKLQKKFLDMIEDHISKLQRDINSINTKIPDIIITNFSFHRSYDTYGEIEVKFKSAKNIDIDNIKKDIKELIDLCDYVNGGYYEFSMSIFTDRGVHYSIGRKSVISEV